jgi:hypothetical protein
MSMLDVISGAMGAFLALTVILLPYYQRDLAADLAEARRAAEMAQAAEADARAEAERAQQMADQAMADTEAANERAAQAQAETEAANERANEAMRRLSRIRFVSASLRWETQNQDVDLHVVDPRGNEFSYRQPRISGAPGELTQDNTRGPGTEIWQTFDLYDGVYRFYADLFARHGNSASPSVTLKILYRDGVITIPPVTLQIEQQRVLLAAVRVSPDGSVTVIEGPGARTP